MSLGSIAAGLFLSFLNSGMDEKNASGENGPAAVEDSSTSLLSRYCWLNAFAESLTLCK